MGIAKIFRTLFSTFLTCSSNQKSSKVCKSCPKSRDQELPNSLEITRSQVVCDSDKRYLTRNIRQTRREYLRVSHLTLKKVTKYPDSLNRYVYLKSVYSKLSRQPFNGLQHQEVCEFHLKQLLKQIDDDYMINSTI
eukprot:NODE_29_length_37665_cov_1.081563.p25 type:complete len:136 gc:universal NODE_29_length_37665_cov_1.081563:13959-14366(+)